MMVLVGSVWKPALTNTEFLPGFYKVTEVFTVRFGSPARVLCVRFRGPGRQVTYMSRKQFLERFLPLSSLDIGPYET